MGIEEIIKECKLELYSKAEDAGNLLERAKEERDSFFEKHKETIKGKVFEYFDYVQKCLSPIIGLPIPKGFEDFFFHRKFGSDSGQRKYMQYQTRSKKVNGKKMLLVSGVILKTGMTHRISTDWAPEILRIYEKNYNFQKLKRLDSYSYCIDYEDREKWVKDHLENIFSSDGYKKGAADSFCKSLKVICDEAVKMLGAFFKSMASSDYTGKLREVREVKKNVADAENFIEEISASLKEKMDGLVDKYNEFTGISEYEPVVSVPLKELVKSQIVGKVKTSKISKQLLTMFIARDQELPDLLEKLEKNNPKAYIQSIKLFEKEVGGWHKKGFYPSNAKKLLSYWKSCGVDVEEAKKNIKKSIINERKTLEKKLREIKEI